ncbi:MAG: hypothetical protein K6D59_08530 [Bacteroidales bacterium]|nr:hypothetical protein [Bacteroidales bacterium]
MSVSIKTAYSQERYSELDKKILFLSCLMDETTLNNYAIDDYFEYYQKRTSCEYDTFHFFASPRISLHFYHNDTNHTGDLYYIQIFKIPQHYMDYYVIKFDSHNTVLNYSGSNWIRVSGYRENDLKIFFDNLVNRFNINRLSCMIQQWVESDPLFNELDWNCLLDGYKDDNTNGDCYKSNTYIRHSNASIGFQPFRGGINAVFSRISLYGYFESYIPY